MEFPSPIDGSEVLSRLSTEEWEDLYRRLRTYAYWKYGWYTWKDAEDFVQEAVLDALSGPDAGGRTWPVLNGGPLSPFHFICGIIRSDVSHHLRSKWKEVIVDGTEAWNLILARVSASWQRPSSSPPDLDHNYYLLCSEILKRVADDSLLTDVVKVLVDTPDAKRSEIADRLEVPESRVHQAMYRLRKKIVGL